MFYMMPNPMFDNAFQSWIAAARDQATAQLIAATTLQKALQSRVVHDLESCSLMSKSRWMRCIFPLSATGSTDTR